MKVHWYFPIRSWKDLRHVFNHYASEAFHFRHSGNYFCPSVTFPGFPLTTFPIPVTFHLMRWSLASPG